MTNCDFTENSADYYGGGLFLSYSTATIGNCIYAGNISYDTGGGVYSVSSSDTFVNCIASGNEAFSGGGGLYCKHSHPSLTNCTVTGNKVTDYAYMSGGLFCEVSSPTVNNCIFWGNGGEIQSDGDSFPEVRYSCVAGGYPGTGNLDANPRFWNVLEGDLRLHLNSPCRDAGDAEGAPATDIREVPRPQGEGVDMGAYEMAEADTDGDGLEDEFETRYAGTDPNVADTDGDGINDGVEWFTSRIWYVKAGSTVANPDGTSWDTAFPAIQNAVDAAYLRSGGEIWVAAGTYTGSGVYVATLREDVSLYGGFAGSETSQDMRDFLNNITIIDGENSRGGVSGADRSTIDGFTITNGHAEIGAGMFCWNASPSILNCTFTANAATNCGGGINCFHASPSLFNCVFSENTAGFLGGGGINCDDSGPFLKNCIFFGNSAILNQGGGIRCDASSPSLADCDFFGNMAVFGGGAHLISSSPSLINCSFIENSTTFDGAGIYCYESSPSLENGVFSKNVATRSGGGMCCYTSTPEMVNCTFSGNMAQSAGGMENFSGSSPMVTNCIFWNDGVEILNDDDSFVTAQYSCIAGSYDGTGNVDGDPLFVDAENNDFRLIYGSACINNGTSANAPEMDIRGLSRPQCHVVEMGAYEFPETSIDGYDGIPEIHSADTNGDRAIDMAELLRLIQLFHMQGYSCDASGASADGYSEGPGEDHSCRRHANDFSEPYWKITLPELLRTVQFFNMSGYSVCPCSGTRDGYCPGVS